MPMWRQRVRKCLPAERIERRQIRFFGLIAVAAARRFCCRVSPTPQFLVDPNYCETPIGSSGVAMPRWLLPENISDVLPREARRVEQLRRALLDLYRGYGYELVIPPLIEHAESLLTGTGNDLDLRTFKLTDQSSGRLLGLRATRLPVAASTRTF